MAVQFYSAFPPPEEPNPKKELELLFDTEPIVGWRIWKISKVDPVLSSVLPTIMEAIESGDVSAIQDSMRFQLLPLATTNIPWPARKRFEAECAQTNAWGASVSFYFTSTATGPVTAYSNHDAPHSHCHCGAWAVKEGTLDAAFHQYAHMKNQPFAWGEVYLWGHVIEAERGYRARFAYPKNLTVVNGTDEMVQDLEHLYGVPVNSGGWKKAWNAPIRDLEPGQSLGGSWYTTALNQAMANMTINPISIGDWMDDFEDEEEPKRSKRWYLPWTRD